MFLVYYLVFFSQFYLFLGFLLDDDHLNNQRNVTIHTDVGTIVGVLRDGMFDGNKYQVKEFLGIPFAEPPSGNNRFRKPIPRASFTLAYYAFSYGPSCLQEQDNELNKSEDCLSLNIYVPHLDDIVGNGSEKSLPVMVWIHGGGFQHGSSLYYPGDALAYFGHVIVVTVNYRLAHLGFLPGSDGTNNFGLWDQHLAIKWVHHNIHAFGGDTARITIFGESAGSSAVIYQALYPGNKGLFQRVIAESGGITSPWAFDKNTTVCEIFKTFSTAVGCSASQDQIKCLRNKTTEEILRVMENVHLPAIHPNADNDFVPKHPFDMLKQSAGLNSSLDVFHSLDLMMGSNSIDGALFLQGVAKQLNISDINQLNVPRSLYEGIFIPDGLTKYFPMLMKFPCP